MRRAQILTSSRPDEKGFFIAVADWTAAVSAAGALQSRAGVGKKNGMEKNAGFMKALKCREIGRAHV